MQILQKALLGRKIEDNQPPGTEDSKVTLSGTWNGQKRSFGLNEDVLSRNILCIGGTGSGKTNAINMMLEGILCDLKSDDVVIVFDTKQDYIKRFYKPERGDLVVGNSSMFKDETQKWNVFHDLNMGVSDDAALNMNVDDFSRGLFKDRGSDSQPFFANAARDVFAAYLRAMLREGRSKESFRRSAWNNRSLVNYFNSADLSKYKTLSEAYPDLRGIQKYFGDGENLQGLGVMAELTSMVRDTFLGIFAEDGDFSIRDFVRKKGGRVLFIEYDMALGNSLTAMYSMLIDLALKEALGVQRSTGKVFFVLDELKLLPKLEHLDDAVNFGRSMGIRVIGGLQSMAQLYEIYGENQGVAVATGFLSLLAFRPNDSFTRNFIKEHFGQILLLEQMLGANSIEPARRLGYVAEDWVLAALNVGEAIIGLTGVPPFQFTFDYIGSTTGGIA